MIQTLLALPSFFQQLILYNCLPHFTEEVASKLYHLLSVIYFNHVLLGYKTMVALLQNVDGMSLYFEVLGN